MFSFLKKRKAEKAAAEGLYVSCCAHARAPIFYKKGGVPDNVQGRFELVAVHLWLVIRHLRRLGAQSFAKRLLHIFFSQMDAEMRETGVGDLAVPHRMKKVAQAFYGRLTAYDAALKRGALSEAFGRNLSNTGADAFSDYFTACDRTLASLPLSHFFQNPDLFCEEFTSFAK